MADDTRPRDESPELRTSPACGQVPPPACAAARPTEARRREVRVVETNPDVTAPAASARPPIHAITRATRRLPLKYLVHFSGPRRTVAIAAAVVVPLVAAGILLARAFGGGDAGRSADAASPFVATDWGPAVRLAPRTFEWSFLSHGELQPLEEKSITAKTWGVITKVWDDGTPVKKGDVVLELDSRQMRRRVADREAEIRIREAEQVRTDQIQKKKVVSAGLNVRRAALELEWQKLNERVLLSGASTEVLERARRELATLELVVRNRAEELKILEELAGQRFATSDEVQRKRLQLAEANLGYERQVHYLNQLLAGPATLEKQEAALRVQIANYALESERRKLESVNTLAGGEVAAAEQRLARERSALEQDRETLSQYTVASPADGLILHANPQWGAWTPGRNVWRGARVLSIPSEGRMKVVTRVDPSTVDSIEVGTPCRVVVPAKPGAEFAGEVVLVSKQGRDEHTELDDYTKEIVGKTGRQTFEVEVKLLSEDPELRPSFRANVRFVLDAVTGALVVPWGAVRRSGGADVVLVLGASGPVERAVTLGASDETSVVVTSGCAQGDLVLLAYGGG